jgi:prevent-host-death family protein
MASRVVSATEFKAKCLAMLDEVKERGDSITITKRGVPVAVVGPPKRKAFKSPANSWAGRAEIVGDIMADMADEWEVVRDPDRVLNPERGREK